MKIECPFCKKEQEVDGDDLPDMVCDEESYECKHCAGEMMIGWYATAEVRNWEDKENGNNNTL